MSPFPQPRTLLALTARRNFGLSKGCRARLAALHGAGPGDFQPSTVAAARKLRPLAAAVGAEFEGPAHGERGRLQLGVHPELLEDVLDVRADGVLADVEVAADPGVVPAAAEPDQHLALAWRQPRQRRAAEALPVQQSPGHLEHHGPRQD